MTGQEMMTWCHIGEGQIRHLPCEADQLPVDRHFNWCKLYQRSPLYSVHVCNSGDAQDWVCSQVYIGARWQLVHTTTHIVHGSDVTFKSIWKFECFVLYISACADTRIRSHIRAICATDVYVYTHVNVHVWVTGCVHTAAVDNSRSWLPLHLITFKAIL